MGKRQRDDISCAPRTNIGACVDWAIHTVRRAPPNRDTPDQTLYMSIVTQCPDTPDHTQSQKHMGSAVNHNLGVCRPTGAGPPGRLY